MSDKKQNRLQKSPNSSIKFLVKHKSLLINLAIVLLFFYLLLHGFLWIISNKGGISTHCAEIKTLISDNQLNWNAFFTVSFDEAVACRTETCKKVVIERALLSLLNTDKPRFFQTSYFVRLNEDENIEKWFRSGEVITTIPTTQGERKVKRLLEGKSGPICTQNWKLDSGLTYMTYLKDGYSEAETIIPVKSEDKILGAVVSRFGD